MKEYEFNSHTRYLFIKKKIINLNTKHPFHLVNNSPWPFLLSNAIFALALGLIMWLHYFSFGLMILLCTIIYVIVILGFWWRDVIIEASYEGQHSFAVQNNIKLGMVFFILSEVMFFFGFFWAYFYNSFVPLTDIETQWPPKGIVTPDPFSIPLFNTLLLLTSGISITYFHYKLIHNLSKKLSLYKMLELSFSLFVTILLGIIFISIQGYEYMELPFTMADNVYGSLFYLLTGFHGLHVLIGTIFLIVCLLRLLKKQYTRYHHIGLECAIWYWHFVDVVWLFLYLCVYCWEIL